MASYIGSIIDGYVTDVLEYLVPSKQNQAFTSSFSYVTWFAITLVAGLLLLLMMCYQCHRPKRARVAFTGVSKQSPKTGIASIRRARLPSVSVQSQCSLDSAPPLSKLCPVDRQSRETDNQQPKLPACSESGSVSSDHSPQESKPDTDSCKVKDAVKRKFDDGSGPATATGRKTSHNASHSPQRQHKDAPKRQHPHAYTYASPNRKVAEVVKSAKANTGSYLSDEVKYRWKGSIPRRRSNKHRSRYAREALPTSLKRSAALAKDGHRRKHRHTNQATQATLHTSSYSSPSSKPVFPQSTQSPPHLVRNAHLRSSPEKRKVGKRSKTLTSGANDSSGVIISKVEVQKGKDNYKRNSNWSTSCKIRTPVTNSNQRSPKKIKKSSVLLKSKKLSGQKKAKKVRKKYKLKEKMKSMIIEAQRVTFPEKGIADKCYLPEAYRGLHMPEVVRQVTSKGLKAESFTIKRTATPVLSSLLGQGAFTTCWPQSDRKSVTRRQEHDDNGNTGRHNTNFLGPKLPECSNETSEETTNDSQTKHNIVWNKQKYNFRSQKGCDSNADTTTNTSLVFAGRANSHNNSCFPLPNVQISKHTLEPQEYRKPFNVLNKKEINGVCQNLRVGETRMNSAFKCCDNQRTEQFCASSHAEDLKQQTECWNSSDKLVYTAINLHDINEKEGLPAKLKSQLPKEMVKGHELTSKRYECSHVAGKRHSYDIRQPEEWTHGGKQVHTDKQPKDNDVKVHREELGKQYFDQDSQCAQQFPYVSFLTWDPEKRQRLPHTEAVLCEKRHVDDVKQHAESKQQADVKPCFYNTDKFHTAALEQCQDKEIPVDFKEFRNLWKTRVTDEGNVFRLTKNHNLPSRLKYDNPENADECTDFQEKHQGNNYIWQDSEDNALSVCCRHEARKGCSSRTVGLCASVSQECSKQLDNRNAQCKKIQLNEHPQVVSRTIKDEHKCLENHKTVIFGAAHAQKVIPRPAIPSKAFDRRNTLASSPAGPAAEEFSDYEIRVHDRLNQSNSSVLTTVGEASDGNSDSTADKQHDVKGKFTQEKQVACVHCYENQQVNDKGRACDCRNLVVTYDGRDENQAVGHDHRQEVQCHKPQLSENPTGKSSVYHGHVVKRNKSLISVRNMLNELTSHLRASHEGIHPTATAHVGKPRAKTLLYLKPTTMMRKDSLSPKEHNKNSMHNPMHCQVFRCSNTTEVTRNAQGTGKYVTCCRPRRSRAFRHEPYRKRGITSSESTGTPSTGGYYWTRNKNNCSPSRKGRYVLGPLVDKHFFPEQQHNSGVAVVEVSASNSTIRQENKRDAVNGEFRHSARKPDTMAPCDNSVQNQEENRYDADEKTKGCQNTVFATPAFVKTRRITEGITSKEHLDLWNQATSGQCHIRHTSAWPVVTIQPADDDSETVKADTCRVRRRPGDAGYTGPAETRYKIIRQYCMGCPETSHTVNRHIPTGNATKGDTMARHITKICTAKRSTAKTNTRTEYRDKGNAQTDHTCGSHKDRIAHTVRHDNLVDTIPESEEPADDTNMKLTETEDGTSRRGHNEDSVIRQDNMKHEAGKKRMADSTQQPATMKPNSAACVSMKRVSEVDAGADQSSVRFATNKQTPRENAKIEAEDTGQHSTARNHDKPVFSSENELKGTGSLQTADKNDLQIERRFNQLMQNTLETATCSQLKTDTGAAINEQIKNDNQPLFLCTADKSESKPKAVSQIGNSRSQYNRSTIIKTQLCLARLKASRGPRSMRYSVSFDRNLRPSKAGVFSGAAGRLQFQNKQTPDTQSHTTQTENSLNSAHVAVQTSPGLQGAARRSRHSKLRRYLANPKLYRDKIAQKEYLLSRHKLSGKPGVNVPDSLFASPSQPVQLGTREHFANSNIKIQKETLLESRAGANNNQNITTVQTMTDKSLEQSIAGIRSHKDFSTGQTRTSFGDLCRNDKALNYQELQNSLWNERRDTRGNFGTEKVPDKKEILKKEAETSTDSRRQDDRWNDRTYILESSNTPLPGAQDKGYHEPKPSSHLDNKEKEKGAVGEVSCQASKGLHAEEVSGETKLITQGETSRSNRKSALTLSDSSTISSRLSELNKFCVSRPIWKNANVEEIDRRVRRALKLREELKQTGSSGSRARSLITSYFEASTTENAGKSPDGMRSGASSIFASDLDSTNKSTYPVSKDQRTSFHDTGSDDTLCQNRDQMPITGNRSSSSDDDHTKQGDTVPGSVGSEAAQSGASLRWAQRDIVSTGAAEQQTQDNTVSEHKQRHGRQSRAEYTSLLEETASESASRVERPSSTVASRRPSNSDSGNSIKRAAAKNKDSPPTKISKVENICNTTPRLIGALVETLPQVPLSSFVEWFIETSDPNNFLLSDMQSSSSDNSAGDSPHCAFEERTPVDDQGSTKMWQTILFNEPHERKSFGNDSKQPHAVSTVPHRKDKPTCNLSEDHVQFFDGLKPDCYTEDRVPLSWKNNMPQSLSSAFPSTPSSATYGMSTLSGNTGEQSDSGRNSDRNNRRQRSFVEAVNEANVSNYPLKTKGDEHLSDNIMKELCAKFAFKSILGNSVSTSNVKSKHRQAERSNASRQLSTSANQKHTVPSEELTSTDSFNDDCYFKKADECTYSQPVSKANLQYLPQTTDYFSSGQITQSESTEESAGNYTNKHDKTGRVDSGTARTKDDITDARITRAHEENAETEPSVDSAATSEQGDTNDKQLIKDVDVDSRCAPGIRHILMKLRQTADADEFPVAKTERTKITLRKCSDVTGIIARFQNTQP